MALDDSDDKQVIEVFARFGRAVYMANVVEDNLVRTLMQIKFMETKEAFIKAQGKGFDRAKMSAEWDAYQKEQHEKMMGQLVGLVEKSADFTDELKNRIKAANKRRNYLVHSYWREEAITFSTPKGRAKMIEELIADTDTFEKLAADVHEATKPIRIKLGIKDEVLDEQVEKQMANLQAGLPLQ
jgi:hypothetical protein